MPVKSPEWLLGRSDIPPPSPQDRSPTPRASTPQHLAHVPINLNEETSHHTRTIREQLGSGVVEAGHISSFSRIPVQQLQQRLSEPPNLPPTEPPPMTAVNLPSASPQPACSGHTLWACPLETGPYRPRPKCGMTTYSTAFIDSSDAAHLALYP